MMGSPKQTEQGLEYVRIPLGLTLAPFVVVPLVIRAGDGIALLFTLGILTLMAAALREKVVIGESGIQLGRVLGRSPRREIEWGQIETVTWSSSGALAIVGRVVGSDSLILLTRIRQRIRPSEIQRAVDRAIGEMAAAAPKEHRYKFVTVESLRRPTETVAATLHARGADSTWASKR